MGLSATASHVIWFIAITAAGAISVDSYFEVSSALGDAREVRESLADARTQTAIDNARFCWDGAKLRVMGTNVGETVIDTLNVSIVVDGIAQPGFVANVETNVDTGFWQPGLNATFNKTGVASEPDRVVFFTAEGSAAHAEKTTCPTLTTVVVTPATASMDIGEVGSFEATGYDQFGALYTADPYVWSSACGTASATDATHGSFTAGTVSGTCLLTATSEGVSGSATITIDPDPPASMVVSPDPRGIGAGGSAAFAATVYDQYGNVNASSVVTWSTNAGSISAGGVLTAQTTPQTGRSVTASTTHGVSDSATVDVYPGATDHITVSPASATVFFNGTRQFTATVYDVYNNANSSVTVSWSATSGSVTTGGLYTAPATGASVTVTASAEGKQGTAGVTVVREVHVDAMATYKAGVPSSSFRKGTDTVEVRTTVRDHESALVQGGASVTVEFEDPDGVIRATVSGTTDGSGIASTSYALPAGAKKGTWIARVTNIAGTDLVYNSALNVVTTVTFTVS